MRYTTSLNGNGAKMATGFDCEFVNPPKELQSECPVCLQILCEPYQAPCCGNSFCRVCIERIKTDNKPCPTCKKKNFNTFHDKRLQRSLYGLEVYCSHEQEGCEWKGELGQLDNHLGGCGYIEINCDFHHAGCDVTLPRKDIPAHLQENLVPHMSLQATRFKELEEEVRKLKQGSMSTLGYIEFVLDNFEQHKKDDDEWYSPPFYTHPGGYKFCLRVDANGNGDGEGTHVSVYVYLMQGEYDDDLEWPFCGEITIQLVDREGEEHHLDTFSFDDETPDDVAGRVTQGEGNEGWGEEQFISHGNLKPNYLKNDCLLFRITKITVL